MQEFTTTYPVMLPTEDASLIHRDRRDHINSLVSSSRPEKDSMGVLKPQHLYLTTKGKFHKDDWILKPVLTSYNLSGYLLGQIAWCDEDTIKVYSWVNMDCSDTSPYLEGDPEDCLKVVATTDKTLGVLKLKCKTCNATGQTKGQHSNGVKCRDCNGGGIKYTESLPTIQEKVINEWCESTGELEEVLLKTYTDCPQCEMCEESIDRRDCPTCSGDGFEYLKTTTDNEVVTFYKVMDNHTAVDKYIIVKDLEFSDFMKDDEGNIAMYDTREEASATCGMYEFPNVLVMKVVYNHIEEDSFTGMNDIIKNM